MNDQKKGALRSGTGLLGAGQGEGGALAEDYRKPESGVWAGKSGGAPAKAAKPGLSGGGVKTREDAMCVFRVLN